MCVCVCSCRFKKRGSDDHLYDTVGYNKPPLPPRGMPMEENVAYGISSRMTDNSATQKRAGSPFITTHEEQIQQQNIKMNADLNDYEYVNDDDLHGNASMKTQQHMHMEQNDISANERTRDDGNLISQEDQLETEGKWPKARECDPIY